MATGVDAHDRTIGEVSAGGGEQQLGQAEVLGSPRPQGGMPTGVDGAEGFGIAVDDGNQDLAHDPKRCRVFEVGISYAGRSYEEGKKITWWDGVKAICAIIWFRFAN